MYRAVRDDRIAAADRHRANRPRPDQNAVKRINDKYKEEMRREHDETEGIAHALRWSVLK